MTTRKTLDRPSPQGTCFPVEIYQTSKVRFQIRWKVKHKPRPSRAWPTIRGFRDARTERFGHSCVKVTDVLVRAHNQGRIHMKMQETGLRNSLWLPRFLCLADFAHQYPLTTAKDVCSDPNWQLVQCFTLSQAALRLG